MIGSPKRSALLSGLLHAAAIVLVLGVTGVRHPPAAVSRFILVTPADIGAYRPVVPRKMEGGGGGGTRSPFGEISGLTSLIGASAPPSQAPAAKPQNMPSA